MEKNVPSYVKVKNDTMFMTVDEQKTIPLISYALVTSDKYYTIIFFLLDFLTGTP